MLHWLLTVTGINAPGSSWYNFWSGICGDLFIVGAVAAFYKRHNCHVHGCWRLGKHPVDGTPYMTCKKHHPGIQYDNISAKHIREAHKKVKRGNPNVKSH